ncbi:MAG: CvpA family protein [Acidobacteria bacterium]|nr:CvpA family protein [Acidobacteriota bacterium]
MANWNWLDWVLTAIILVSVITAISKGLVGELISLASVVAGVVVAVLDYGRVAPWFEDLTRSHEIALGISFLILFVGTLVLGAVVAALARKLIQRAELQWFDRFLGGIFGLVRGVLVDCIVLLILMAFTIKERAVQKSVLATYITSGSRLVAVFMPRKVKMDFRASFEKFRLTMTQADKKTVGNQPLNHTTF